jgi:SAM-dependent methyltransferase
MSFIKNLIYKFLNKKISIIYNKRFSQHQNTPKGVFWNSKLSQDLRLNIILDKIIDNSKSDTFTMADIGCGYGRCFEIIKERNLQDKIKYSGFDINKNFISFCKNNIKLKQANFYVDISPYQQFDYVVMSGTYNLTPINNLKLWESYITKNLKSNWKNVDKAMIFNCLVDKERKIKNKLYYTEISWIKKFCEENLNKPEFSKHNLLEEDVTVFIEKN